MFAAGAELHHAVAAGPVTLRLVSADDGPMGGTVSVWAEKLVPIVEGLGDSVAVAPGGTAAFSFTLSKAGAIGVGLRADPDQAQARLLDAKGAIVGEGVAQLQHLAAGDYVLEARVPPSAPPTLLRPALVGVTPARQRTAAGRGAGLPRIGRHEAPEGTMMALLSGLFCYRTRSKTIVMPRLDLGIHGIGLVTSDGCLATSHATRPGRPLRDCVDTRLKAWHDGTLCALLAALALLPSLAFAQVPPQLDHLQRADGTRVVPDHFLRSWDPVTLLFPSATGPAAGGPEDHPERFATLSPAKDGAWTWLTPTTLQFRPTEPWQPLRRETVTLGGAATTLVPLLPVPSATGPAADDSGNGTADLDTVALQFPQPVDLAALARLITIEIGPQTRRHRRHRNAALRRFRPAHRRAHRA